MGEPVTAQRNRHHAAGVELPTPLYPLYCELDADQTSSGEAGKQLTVEIVDAVGAAAAQLGSVSLAVDETWSGCTAPWVDLGENRNPTLAEIATFPIYDNSNYGNCAAPTSNLTCSPVADL
ncbi:hypothetical protein PF003_g23320 [Phytophthora fragariae]|nr:hypothetical protein PF003_g23320 [Phytophthora fragariae]